VAEDVLAELDQLVASSVSAIDLETTRRILKGVMTL
jgi:hypothetical protein